MEHASTLRNAMVTTALELPGYRVLRSIGVVRGISVRSRSTSGLLTELCEKTRLEALDFMLRHAAGMGANAVIAMRYDATEAMDGVTEVLAYGTAVIVEPVPQGLSFQT